MINTEELKRLRFQKKMTQMELANAAGLSQAHYCMVENGKDSPSIKRLTLIAKALGCSIKDLVLDTEAAEN